MNLIHLAERGWLPDALVRFGIRRLCNERLADSFDASRHGLFIEHLKNSPLAIATDKANEQHYEVPAAFFEAVLGPRLKYSCCYYPDNGSTLADAEVAMLELTCQRAEITDGMDILELGCGWGSLSLWLAEHYPSCRITAVSNSHGQRHFIEARRDALGLDNLHIITADMREFSIEQTFDRVISIEMFEHMRNYQLLLRRVARWLRPAGKLFVHIFCHRELAYTFETDGAKNWMGQHFFTGGMMPSFDLFRSFDDDLAVTRQWQVDGTHYARTSEDWLRNLDRQRHDLVELFHQSHGLREARIMLQRWRMFFLACAELFASRNGSEWFVGHYLFELAGQRTSSELRAVNNAFI